MHLLQYIHDMCTCMHTIILLPTQPYVCMTHIYVLHGVLALSPIFSLHSLFLFVSFVDFCKQGNVTVKCFWQQRTKTKTKESFVQRRIFTLIMWTTLSSVIVAVFQKNKVGAFNFTHHSEFQDDACTVALPLLSFSFSYHVKLDSTVTYVKKKYYLYMS